MAKGILTSQGGTKYVGPIARKPDAPSGQRNLSSGSRPTKGFTQTPSGGSRDESGRLGRSVPGSMNSGSR
jgi:hypothetical protein